MFDNNNYDLIFKLVLIGDSGVGKTNILSRYIKNEFSYSSKSTVGVEFGSKIIKTNDKLIKIQIWDTAGQERYKSITSAYYKGAKGALVVYDTTQKSSFENVDKWMTEIKERGSPDIKIMLVGNKIDLVDEREVKREEGLSKAKNYEIPMMEASALDSTNVKEAFFDLLKEMYKDLSKKIDIVENQNDKGREGIQLETTEEKTKKGCC